MSRIVVALGGERITVDAAKFEAKHPHSTLLLRGSDDGKSGEADITVPLSKLQLSLLMTIAMHENPHRVLDSMASQDSEAIVGLLHNFKINLFPEMLSLEDQSCLQIERAVKYVIDSLFFLLRLPRDSDSDAMKLTKDWIKKDLLPEFWDRNRDQLGKLEMIFPCLEQVECVLFDMKAKYQPHVLSPDVFYERSAKKRMLVNIDLMVRLEGDVVDYRDECDKLIDPSASIQSMRIEHKLKNAKVSQPSVLKPLDVPAAAAAAAAGVLNQVSNLDNSDEEEEEQPVATLPMRSHRPAQSTSSATSNNKSSVTSMLMKWTSNKFGASSFPSELTDSPVSQHRGDFGLDLESQIPPLSLDSDVSAVVAVASAPIDAKERITADTAATVATRTKQKPTNSQESTILKHQHYLYRQHAHMLSTFVESEWASNFLIKKVHSHTGMTLSFKQMKIQCNNKLQFKELYKWSMLPFPHQQCLCDSRSRTYTISSHRSHQPHISAWWVGVFELPVSQHPASHPSD